MKTCLIAVVGWLLVINFSIAEPVGKRTEHLTLQLDGVTVHYYVTLPSGYDAKKAYGLIIGVPGVGSDKGTVEKNQAINYARRFSFTSVIKNNYIGLSIWYTGKLANPWDNSAAHKATLQVMEAVRKTYSVDAKRIYIYCFSAGGGFMHNFVWGSYFTKETFPFAGAIFCSANCRTGNVGSAVVPRDMPVFIEVGDKDIGGIEGQSTAFRDALKKSGYKDVEYHVIKGQGHVISDAESGLPVNATDLIAKWLARVDKRMSK
jgi:dipeptidyl aminopeptidase/acylaminoacyl peptidase